MPRRLLILPVVLVAAAALAWFTAPTVKHWLAPSSVVPVELLRLGMPADEVRAALGEPRSRGFGTWRFCPQGHRDEAVLVYFNADSRVAGWTDLATGENVGGMGEVRPALPRRGPWP